MPRLHPLTYKFTFPFLAALVIIYGGVFQYFNALDKRGEYPLVERYRLTNYRLFHYSRYPHSTNFGYFLYFRYPSLNMKDVKGDPALRESINGEFENMKGEIDGLMEHFGIVLIALFVLLILLPIIYLTTEHYILYNRKTRRGEKHSRTAIVAAFHVQVYRN